MKRILLGWFLALAISTPAISAVVHPTPVVSSGVETIKFRNGVYPDASYSGMILQKIDQSNATISYPNSDSLTIGYGAVGPGTDEKKALFKVDLSAIPSSAVILDARLRILVSAYSGYSAAATYDQAWLNRILIPWSSSATWNNRGTSPDSAWGSAGVNDLSMSIPSGTTAYGATAGASISILHWGMTGYHTKAANFTHTYKREGGYFSTLSADTLYSGAFALSAGASADRTELPDSYWFVRPKSTTFVGPLWIDIDITRLVRNWVSKTWANYGAVISIEEVTNTANNTINFAGVHRANTAQRPLLTVRYIYATASGGGGGGDRSLGFPQTH